MADDLESKRAELTAVYDRLEKLERGRAEQILIDAYRALARQIADQISDLEQREAEQPRS